MIILQWRLVFWEESRRFGHDLAMGGVLHQNENDGGSRCAEAMGFISELFVNFLEDSF